MKNRNLAMIAMVFSLLLLTLPVNVFAKSQQKSDNSLQSRIEEQLSNHDLLRGNAIDVSANESVVTISGTVATLYQARQVAQVVEKTADDHRLVNDLAVKPLGVPDQQLQENVNKQLQHNVQYSVYDWVNFDVKGGTVTLKGWVYEPWHKRLFEHVVERVPGVSRINNDIKVESQSLFDDEIRYRAARLIYNDRFFAPVTEISAPAVHLIVNEGVVTLEGTVDTKHDRNWAMNTILMNTDALSVVNNLQLRQASHASR